MISWFSFFQDQIVRRASAMYRVLVFVLFVQKGVLGFFDLSDIEDPFTLFWSHKNSLLQDKIETCTTNLNDGTLVNGVCENKAQCILTKGLPLGVGSCSKSFSTCCNYVRSCDKTTKSRESYFTSGADVSNYRECNYNIEILNDNVCQIRIDFESFILAPPTYVKTGTTDSAYKCATDSLTITPNPNNVPQLCGYNSGQHAYVAVEEGKKSVLLNFALKERSSSQALVMPEWKIKIRQIECPKISTFIDKFKNYQAAKDFPLLAPHYAVQYFTERTGYIRTFGYDDSADDNKYTNGQKYAIAFRRTRGVCGVKLSAEHFQLPEVGDSTCPDYLFVPPPNDIERCDICGTLSSETSIIASPPGPIILHFVSGSTFSMEDSNYGFKIQYELISSC